MDKLKMHTPDLTEEHIEQIGKLFPNTITEVIKDGKTVKAIDFDMLKQELSDVEVDGNQERYQFTWPDKRKAIMLANQPIAKTLRPCREKSVDFDNTENIYIEGDNLDALKLLQETYLGKVKMIYIDPPYNTGNDFVYEDDFSQSNEDYKDNSGQTNDAGDRLVQNTESNGRFHTDWLNMIYPRLTLAKNLLRSDGFIFISIDDHEIANLKKMCDSIFGEENFLAQIVWQKRTSPDARKKLSTGHEYILAYMKNSKISEDILNYSEITKDDKSKYINPDNDPKGPWVSTDFGAQGYRPNQMYKIVTPTGKEYFPSEGRCWKNTEDVYKCLLEEGRMWFGGDGNGVPRKKLYLSERDGKSTWTWWTNGEVGHTQEATQQLTKLLGKKTIFDYPKPVRLVRRIIKLTTGNNDIVMDFFSGSATTAHAIMELNAEDKEKRKYILVQIPEQCDISSDAYHDGYKTICDIGEERIIRAGKKIREEQPLLTEELDTGFRVFSIDSTNMQDVYYSPASLNQEQINLFSNNIKEGRTSEDLLFQVMLDLGILLSSKIEKKKIAGKTVYSVADGYLLACFDNDVTEETVTEIAKQKPYYAVFRDSSMANDSVATNFDQIFQTYSPDTKRKVI